VESKRERRQIAKKAAASLHHIICKAQTTKALCSSLLLETQPDGLRKRFFFLLATESESTCSLSRASSVQRSKQVTISIINSVSL
jgi:hypothetical protein